MKKKITIIDYGLGNIFSVSRVFARLNCDVNIAKTAQEIMQSEFLVLPGVGAFKKAMEELYSRDFITSIRKYALSGKPILGICLGMQLFFEKSEENGDFPGLGLIPGKVQRIIPNHSLTKVPHIGWSKLSINPQHPSSELVKTSLIDKFAYFVHSYHPIALSDHILATTTYEGHTINSMVMKDNIIGCQFHPEKSAENFFDFLSIIIFQKT